MSQAGHAIVSFNGHQIDLCKHVLIYGSPGIGKTLLVRHLKQLFNVIEVNASDTRTLAQLQGILAGAGKMNSLAGKQQIMVFDEMDNMAKTGIDFLISLLGPPKSEYEKTFTESNGQPTVALKRLFIRSSRQSRLHIVMLCNYVSKINIDITTNDRVKVVEFIKPDPVEIESLLQLLAMKYWDDPDEQEYDESLTPSRERIKQISVECHGDVRNAMEMLLGSDSYDAGDDTRPLDYTGAIFTTSVDKRDDLYDALVDDDINPTTICTYLAFNIPRYYTTSSEISVAFDAVNRAELLKFKTDVNYVWGVLVYGMPCSKYTTMKTMYPPKRAFAVFAKKQQLKDERKKQKQQQKVIDDNRGSRKSRRTKSEQPQQAVTIAKPKKRMVL
jgi:hypothetical protein